MSKVPIGTDHPPPAQKYAREKFTRGRIAWIVSDVVGIPFSLVASLTGAHSDTPIDPPFLGRIKERIQEIFGREIPPLPERSPEGSAWTLGSLTAYIGTLVNQETGYTP